MPKFNKAKMGIVVGLTALLISTFSVFKNVSANPLKCDARQPLLCRHAIIELLQKAGLNQFIIKDGDILLTIDPTSTAYQAIKNNPIGIFVHEYDGARLVSRELTVGDVVSFESADTALRGHHSRYGLNVLTTLATSGSFAQPMPELVKSKIPGESNPVPVKLTVVTNKGEPNEEKYELVIRKNDDMLVIGTLVKLGILDANLGVVSSKLDSKNSFSLDASAIAKLAGVPISALTNGDKATVSYTFSKASEVDVHKLDAISQPKDILSTFMTKPVKPDVPKYSSEKIADGFENPDPSRFSGIEKELIKIANLITTTPSDARTLLDSSIAQAELKRALPTIRSYVQSLSASRQSQYAPLIAEIDSRVSGAPSFMSAFSNLPEETLRKALVNQIHTDILGAVEAARLQQVNTDKIDTYNLATAKDQALRDEYNKKYSEYLSHKKQYDEFLSQQASIQGTVSERSEKSFFAIDGKSTYENIHSFLEAHGHTDANGKATPFDELPTHVVNLKEGGSTGYFGTYSSLPPEFLTSEGNPTPKPYLVRVRMCQDAGCSTVCSDDACSQTAGPSGWKLFRLDDPKYKSLFNWAGFREQVSDGSLQGASPLGDKTIRAGKYLIDLKPVQKDPATQWSPALLHTLSQSSTGIDSIPAHLDLSGYSVGYQVCGPAGCYALSGADGKSLPAWGVTQQLGIVVEQSSLLKDLMNLGVVGASGEIMGVGKDPQTGEIVVYTKIPTSSDIFKFKFKKLSTQEVKESGLRPIAKAVSLAPPSIVSGSEGTTRIYTLTVADAKGGAVSNQYPGIVTEAKLESLLTLGVVKKENDKFVIQGVTQPDGTIETPTVIDGNSYVFSFHPGVYGGLVELPPELAGKSLTLEESKSFFAAQSEPLDSMFHPHLIPLKQQNNNKIDSHVIDIANAKNQALLGPSTAKGGNSNESKVQPKTMSLPDVGQALENAKKGQKVNTVSTVMFAKNLAANEHVDALNVNSFFITPAAGHQVELSHAPKFFDSNNQAWLCMISGLGQRVSIDQTGQKTVHGHAETLNFVDQAVRDIPG
ncbi:MAG: hypothetical protein ACO376_00125, partial [Gammaproteobacteria bacterium]